MTHKTDKQQGAATEHRELYLKSYDKSQQKRYDKVCVHETESLCCATETNT